jgi:hypothetical protein
MDIFFTDPSAVPLPPAEVRIVELQAQPWPDGRRVHVYLELTPFQKRPDGEISITNQRGEELANASIIETLIHKMDFTLHLRGAELLGPFTVTAQIFYIDRSEGQETTPENFERPRSFLQIAQAHFDLPS